MERLLVEAAAKDAVSIERYVGFASSGVTMDNIGDLLNHAVHLKSGTAIHTREGSFTYDACSLHHLDFPDPSLDVQFGSPTMSTPHQISTLH